MALSPASRQRLLLETADEAANKSAPAGFGDTGKLENPTIPTDRQTPKILTDGGQPTMEDYEKVGKLLQLFSEARNHRRPMVRRWNRSYKMVRNKFWDMDARPGW